MATYRGRSSFLTIHAVDRLIDAKPAITDNETKKLAGYNSLLTESERELKRKARETRS